MSKKTPELETLELKPMGELEGFDFSDDNAFVCDMETGVCGPVNQEKEKNK